MSSGILYSFGRQKLLKIDLELAELDNEAYTVMLPGPQEPLK